MKILKYTKTNKNTYQVILEKETITLYDEIILKYELLLKKEISEEEIEKLKYDNQLLDSYYDSLTILKSKLKSKKELYDLLKKKEYSTTSIDYALTRLEKEGYLNDLGYAEIYIDKEIQFTLDGPIKIRKKLIDLGIPEEYISFEKYDSLWDSRIKKLIEKQIKSNHNKSSKELKNKITNYLFNKGYSFDMISSVVDSIYIPIDDSVLIKEKNKLERKLSRKYSGKELEYQIRNKLYQKGFSKEEIDLLEE